MEVFGMNWDDLKTSFVLEELNRKGGPRKRDIIDKYGAISITSRDG